MDRKKIPKKMQGHNPQSQPFPTFFQFFLNVENGVGRLFILNLVWQRLSRSILTYFLF